MELILPDLGEGIIEGEIVQWLVNTGDAVAEDQVVLEIMTDKATVEIPSVTAGTVSEILANPGDIVKVGMVIMRLGGAKGAPKSGAVSKAPAPATTPAPKINSVPVLPGSVLAAPSVRKAAREKNIDLQGINGSGPSGRILHNDLQHSNQAQTTPIGARMEKVPLRGLRKRIAEKMALSKQKAAHFTCVEEVDVTELVAFRNSIKDAAKAQGSNITFMPFIMKACVLGLKKYPILNATLHEEREIHYKHYFNFGVAVDTEDGLTVPVVADVDKKSIIEIARNIKELSGRAHASKLTMDDFKDGTFTISNAGKVGGLFATPIINYPELAILGVHEIRKRPMVVDDTIVIRNMLYLSISLDHRIVDGAIGIRFLNEMINYLSNPKAFIGSFVNP